MKYVNLLIFVLSIMLLTSCGNVKDITIEDVKQARLKSITGTTLVVEIEAKVNNPTGHKLTIRKGEFDIERKGYAFADAKLKEKVSIPARSADYHSLQIEVSLLDVFSFLGGGLNFDRLANELTISGYLKGGTALYSKKYNFKDVGLNELHKVIKY